MGAAPVGRAAQVPHPPHEGDDEIAYLKLWFYSYDPMYWWFGIADMARRLILTSLLIIR